MLVGIGLLNTKALAGTADLVLSHGLLKGGLFLLCGVVLVRFRDIEELRLYGSGRAIPVTGVLWGLGTIGLIGVPYIGTFLGHSLIEDGATVVGIEWAQPILMIAAGVAAAAMLRAGARVFLGWGTRDDPLLSVQKPEEPNERTANMPLMIAVAAVAIALGLVVSVIPGLHPRSEHAAERFRDRAAYTQLVLHGKEEKPTPRLPFSIPMATAPSWAYGFGSLAIAVAGAAFGLWRIRLPKRLRDAGARLFEPPLGVLKDAHSGIIGDYVLWIAVGTAVLGGVWALVLR
jgi:multicomponent Na+:H+ antiporter subunit D